MRHLHLIATDPPPQLGGSIELAGNGVINLYPPFFTRGLRDAVRFYEPRPKAFTDRQARALIILHGVRHLLGGGHPHDPLGVGLDLNARPIFNSDHNWNELLLTGCFPKLKR